MPAIERQTDKRLQRSARRYKARKQAQADLADAEAQINDYLNGEDF